MSKVEELLAKYNSNGVKKIILSSIGDFENIGVDKKTVEGEPLVTLLNYVDVYHNKTIKKGVPQMTVSSPINKVDKCSVEQGDIFITPTSETVDDIGHSALVLETLPQTVYSYHIMRYRLHNVSMTTASYINQCFESCYVKQQILKKAQGLTRFGVSKSKFGEIEIPLPHIKVQEEIVKILDSFTNLIDALNKELSLRQKQFEYYREKLLTFDDKSLLKPINEIGTLFRGNGLQKKDFVDEGVGCIHYGQIYTKLGFSLSKPLTYVTKVTAKPLTKVRKGDLVIACTSENIEDVCKSVVWEGEEEIVTGGHACVLRHNENPRYIGYFFQTHQFFMQKKQYAYGAKVIDIKTEKLGEILIPIPPLAIQQSIVEKLDAFESLISSLKEEIALRQKQYEYYREKLLTFN